MNSNSIKFLIDTNSFITPYHSYYHFDFDSQFWHGLENHINAGDILILDMVKNEIDNCTDDLSLWFSNLKPPQIIKRSEAAIISNYSNIMKHIQSEDCYNIKALNSWSGNIADGWLVATASAYNYTVVTFERKSNPTAQYPSSKVKIPDICNAFNVRCVNLFDMMRSLSIKL